jgi:sugar phosphate isomerase/epimerase
MNRREFVQRMVLASAVVAGGGLAGYGCVKPANNLRWAMGWILWREYRKTPISLTEAIQNMSDLGLDGLEFTPRQDDLAKQGFTRESFRDFLAEKKLSIAGNYFGADFHNPEKHADILSAFRNTLENLKFYGSKNVVIGPPDAAAKTRYRIKSKLWLLS